MSTQRDTYHHGDLRAVLVKAATQRMQNDGINAISVRALARDIGVAHRASYQHFADKDALIAAVLAAGYARLEKRIANSINTITAPEEQLRAIAKAFAAFAYAEPKIYLAMVGPRMNDHGKYPELEAALGQGWAHIVNAIKLGAKSGIFLADTHMAAVIFWGGLQGVITQTILNRIKVKATERKAFLQTAADRLIVAIKR